MADETHADQVEKGYYSSSVGNLMDTRTSHLDDLLLEKLEEAFDQETSAVRLHHVAKISIEHTPIDLAFASAHLPPMARPVVYENLPSLEAKITYMINADKNTRNIILRRLKDRDIKELLENMPPDEAVEVMEWLPERRFLRVLEVLDSRVATRICELKSHGPDTAGRLMSNEFFAFTLDTTIGEVSACIRDNPGIDLTRRIFVLEEDREIVGFVPSRNLIVNAPHLPLKQVMQPISHKVGPEATRDEVIDLVARYNIPALPVVDEEDRLLGVVTYEDVIEAMEDLVDDTLAHIAGTSEDLGEHDPVLKRFLQRAPWLLFTLFAGLTTASILMNLTERPWYLLVACFAPLINAMSGNVGVQCSTVLVRSMATGQMSVGTRGDAVAKELTLGLVTGACFGLACGTIVYFLSYLGIGIEGFEAYAVGVAVCAGMICACTTSSILGVLSPFVFARIGVDPAVASGPIVTSCNDLISTTTYCFVVAFLGDALFYLLHWG